MREKLEYRALFNHPGGAITGTAYSTRQPVQGIYSTRNQQGITRWSFPLAKGVALSHNVLAVGRTSKGLYVLQESEGTPGQVVETFFDEVDRLIYHRVHDGIAARTCPATTGARICYHLGTFWAVKTLVDNVDDEFVENFNHIDWAGLNTAGQYVKEFVVACDALYYVVRDNYLPAEITDDQPDPLVITEDLTPKLWNRPGDFVLSTNSSYVVVNVSAPPSSQPATAGQTPDPASPDPAGQAQPVSVGIQTKIALAKLPHPDNLPPEIQALVPPETVYIPVADEVETLCTALSQRLNVFLIGDTGCGKTTLVSWIAHELGVPMLTLQFSGGIEEADVIGYNTLKPVTPVDKASLQTQMQEILNTPGPDQGEKILQLIESSLQTRQSVKWVDGVVPYAMRLSAQYPVILYLDELPTADPGVLSVINEAMDHRKQLRLKQHENELVKADPMNFFVIAAGNLGETYTASNRMDAAQKDRWVFVNMGYADYSRICMLLESEDKGNLKDARTIDLMLRVYDDLQKKKEMGDIGRSASVRSMIQWAQLISGGLAPKTAAKLAIVDKLAQSDLERKIITDVVEASFV